MENKFIVAEITKNWERNVTLIENLISGQFERVIAFNLERGYKLIDWKMNHIVYGNILTETIIAIFEKI